jgi:hypothetical protein
MNFEADSTNYDDFALLTNIIRNALMYPNFIL